MKKILIILCSSMLFFYNAQANNFSNNKEYETINKNISNHPKLEEFFSFFCPYCYEFEKIHYIKNLIKNIYTLHLKKYSYHINFSGDKFGEELTKSWIMAQQMKIEEKILMPIFEGIHKSHTIKNINDIKKIFLEKSKISENQYNKFLNSFSIQILTNKNNNKIKKMNINRIPVILINNKYLIDYYKLEFYFKKEFSKNFLKLIYFLLLKDKN